MSIEELATMCARQRSSNLAHLSMTQRLPQPCATATALPADPCMSLRAPRHLVTMSPDQSLTSHVRQPSRSTSRLLRRTCLATPPRARTPTRTPNSKRRRLEELRQGARGPQRGGVARVTEVLVAGRGDALQAAAAVLHGRPHEVRLARARGGAARGQRGGGPCGGGTSEAALLHRPKVVRLNGMRKTTPNTCGARPTLQPKTE